VYDASQEICLSVESHSAFTRVGYQKSRRLKGLSLNLSSSQADVNYFHWLTDALPKLGIAEAIGYKIEDFDYFIVGSSKQRFQKETLQILEIPEAKIIALDEFPYLHCENLLVTTATCQSGNVSSWINNFLRDKFLNRVPQKGFPDKVFTGRKTMARRKLTNEDEISAFLKEKGFQTFFLEEMSIMEQLEYSFA
jgi:capsular polysaccharide biosynthesis protein